ncbi:hypothetical protein FGIG_04665 [Fasciola gigantica]|uniref:Uncharacterized protein n=1 Tax=Fasciola gigantica TaxID=46835 RepID=A0A504YLU5_FASGI|nr:hypothetical protein FGIG_04665 [Fasciola gigantica]
MEYFPLRTEIILDVTLFRLWRSAENWRRSQLLIMHTLLRLVSDAARGLPSLLTILPLFYVIGLYLLVGLSALIVVHMLSVGELFSD